MKKIGLENKLILEFMGSYQLILQFQRHHSATLRFWVQKAAALLIAFLLLAAAGL